MRSIQTQPNPALELNRYGRPRMAASGCCAHFPSAASRVLPPRAAQLYVSRRTNHAVHARFHLVPEALNSRMHGLGQRVGTPDETVGAFAGQSLFSQSVNWPAHAGRGGAEDGAVLFVFVEAAPQPIKPAAPVCQRLSLAIAPTVRTSMALAIKRPAQPSHIRKGLSRVAELFNSTKPALSRTLCGG